MTRVFCHSEMQDKVGYVTSKISEKNQKSILDFIKNNPGKFGERVISQCELFKKMTQKKIKETLEDGIQSNYNNKSNKDRSKGRDEKCLIF